LAAIEVLPEDIIEKIAAGEVIERPSSIVKELVENSLDAGARTIDIDLVKGGIETIRVVDDGEGIEIDDAPRAFLRFATSKIREFNDLVKVRSFGFRGEALPSIAAVAKVEMFTRKRESLEGTRVVVEEGKVKEVTPAGCPPGTAIKVTELFHNVPVRKKFLRSPLTEQGYSLDLISRFALCFPHVHFNVTLDGRSYMTIPPCSNIKDRLPLLFGAELAKKTVSLHYDRNNYKLSGFISQPDLQWTHTRYMYCFVNDRFVKDSFIQSAIIKTYRSLVGTKKYPLVVLKIDVPPEKVDVNVHPSKLEVRFSEPAQVFQLIGETITKALAKTYTGWSNSKDATAERIAEDVPLSYGTQNKQEEYVQWKDLSYVGHIDATYLVFTGKDKLLLMDQHAAHERLLFEKFKTTLAERRLKKRFLIPRELDLSPKESAFLLAHKEILHNSGWDIEVLETGRIIINALPEILTSYDPKEIILSLIEEIEEAGTPREDTVKDAIAKFLACRAAVKKGDVLKPAEGEALLKSLSLQTFPLTCPHGRPIMITFSLMDLEKMFKRRE